jgi:hypothetical protein
MRTARLRNNVPLHADAKSGSAPSASKKVLVTAEDQANDAAAGDKQKRRKAKHKQTNEPSRKQLRLQQELEDIVREEQPSLLPFLSVLNVLLDLKFAHHPQLEEYLTSNLTVARERYIEKLSELVILFIRLISTSCRITIVLDSCQWMSKDDWGLTLAVVKALKNGTLRNCALWFASRPLDSRKYAPKYSKPPPEYHEILQLMSKATHGSHVTESDDETPDEIAVNSQRPAGVRVTNSPMGATCVILPVEAWELRHTQALLTHHFFRFTENASGDVRTVDPELVNLVHERTGGVPLFM